MEQTLTKQKLCCLIRGEPKTSGRLKCSCGRKVCDDCVTDIFTDSKGQDMSEEERISLLWPDTSLNRLADNHYFYDKNCDTVKYYISTYGEPKL